MLNLSFVDVVIVFALIFLLSVALSALVYCHQIMKKDREIAKHDFYKPVEITKEIALDVLGGKTAICGEYVNFLNQLDGFPMLSRSEGQCIGRNVVYYTYIRVARYAHRQGWISDEALKSIF